MLKPLVIALVIFIPNTCQLDLDTGLLRAGFRWLSEQRKELPKIEDNIEETLSNSVHGEKILKSKIGFISSSVKRVFGLIGRQTDQDQIVDKHHKRTNLLEVAKNLNLTTFLEKVKEAGIDDILDHEGLFTVFAPTNEAFDRIPSFCGNIKLKDLMKFHVAKGRVPSSDFKNNLVLRSLLTHRGTRINVYKNKTVVTANGRKISQMDFKASNGILHVLDDVMCAVYRGSAAYAIKQCPKFKILSSALNTTGQDVYWDRIKQLTVFAPTDDAFGKLPPEVLNALLSNVTALTETLNNHAVHGVWYSLGLENGQILQNYQDQNLTVAINGTTITVNNATVILGDATVKRGVVHALDTVLLNPNISEPVMRHPEPSVLLV